MGPRAGPTKIPCKIHMERVPFCKLSACGEPEEREYVGGFSSCSLTAVLADVSRAGKTTGVDRRKKCKQKVTTA